MRTAKRSSRTEVSHGTAASNLQRRDRRQLLENNDKFTIQSEIANSIDCAEVREIAKEEHMYRLAKKLAEMLEEAPGIFARLEPVKICPAPRNDSILMRHELIIRG